MNENSPLPTLCAVKTNIVQTWKTKNDCAINTHNNNKYLGKKKSTVALLGKKTKGKPGSKHKRCIEEVTDL